MKTRHSENLAFLETNIEPGGIVITHFAPSWRSISPQYGTSKLNGYYASDLEDMILRKRPALRVHGHIHARSDYRIGETRVICNAAGYEGGGPRHTSHGRADMNDLECAAELRRCIRLFQAELNVIEGRMPKPTGAAPDPISDHAVMRYLERVKGVEMRRVRTDILPHERRGLLAAGPGRIKCNGYELVCSKSVVVTVI